MRLGNETGGTMHTSHADQHLDALVASIIAGGPGDVAAATTQELKSAISSVIEDGATASEIRTHAVSTIAAVTRLLVQITHDGSGEPNKTLGSVMHEAYWLAHGEIKNAGTKGMTQ